MITESRALGAQETSAVLEAAIRAPSVHNSQPWRFRVMPERIELYADPSRGLPIADPESRELRIACGAALFNLRLALLMEGVEPQVQIHPGGDLLATVDYRGPTTPTTDEAAMFHAIGRRRTNRKPFLDLTVDDADIHALAAAAEIERGRLEIVSRPQDLSVMHRLLVAAHAAQVANPQWAAEFSAWVGRSRAAVDGVALASSGPNPEPQDMWALRDFGLGRAVERAPGKDFESEPLIAVVATYVDDPAAQVQAGQVLQRVLLTATVRGLAASFMSQFVEVDSARDELREMLGNRVYPQVVLRIGHGSPVPASSRRPIADVLIEA